MSYIYNNIELLSNEFLRDLQSQPQREIFARVAALDINEQPIEYIEGKITGGSISIDGNSAVRRTCNLSMVANEVNIQDVYWGIRSKVAIEIGLKNTLKEKNKIYNYSYLQDENGNLIYQFETESNDIYRSVYDSNGKILYYEDDTGYKISKNIANKKYTPSLQLKAKVVYNDKNSQPDIVWFPQGIYVLSSFNTSISASNYNISLSGKDKMCMLNGDLGGQLFSSIDFGTEELIDYIYRAINISELDQKEYKSHTYYVQQDGHYELLIGEWDGLTQLYEQESLYVKKQIPIHKILKEAIHIYAKEPFENIIINDLEAYGLEQLQYKGDQPMYVLKRVEAGTASQIMFADNNSSFKNLLNDNPQFVFDSLTENFADISEEFTHIWFYNDNFYLNRPDIESNEECIEYTVAQINYGEDIGFRLTDLTYPGELISSVGDTLTSVLDKIKNFLSNFEYFYDINGKFVFQKKRIYVDTNWNSLVKVNDEIQIRVNEDETMYKYNFEGSSLVTAYTNNPSISNIRNDFSIWGKRTTSAGVEVPIHARYAIDKKPVYYHAFDGYEYVTNEWISLQMKIKDEDDNISSEIYQKVNDLPFILKDADETTSKWWNLKDWKRWYERQTGVLPLQPISDYCDEGFMGRIACYNSDGEIIYIEEDFSQYTSGLVVIVLQNKIISSISRTVLYKSYSLENCPQTIDYFETLIANNSSLSAYIYQPVIKPVISIKDIAADLKAGKEKTSTVLTSNHKVVDWRELIYQMAKDHFAAQESSNVDITIPLSSGNSIHLTSADKFLTTVKQLNSQYYPTGYTGYEQYYTDILGFWRELYNPSAEPVVTWHEGYYKKNQKIINPITGHYEIEQTWQDPMIKSVDIMYYTNLYKDYENIKISNDPNLANKKSILIYFDSQPDEIKNAFLRYATLEDTDPRLYWNTAVFEAPDTLNFWMEFLDDEQALSSFSVSVIGQRARAFNDDQAHAIHYASVPDVILNMQSPGEFTSWIDLKDKNRYEYYNTGYTILNLSTALEKYFSISYKGRSIKDAIDEQLYKEGYCGESITITAIPIYNLEPNTRIHVCDKNTGINGDYLITKISLPLAYNGTMSISAIKAPDKFY